MTAQSTLVLVHGAWFASWNWHAVLPLLPPPVPVRQVELPSVGTRAQRMELWDDAAAVRATVQAIDGPVVVCAHSYGGAVATQALAGLNYVSHIVFLCAFLLAPGESLLEAAGGTPPYFWRVRAAEGYVEAADPGQVFFHDVGEDWRRDAVARMRPHQVAPFHQRLTAAAWQDLPSTYVVCTRDQAIPPEQQRALSARAQTGLPPLCRTRGYLSGPGSGCSRW